MHLTADKRHIQYDDAERFAASAQTRLALEFALDEEIRDFALRVRPADVCLVPEDVAHRDTLGGFDVLGYQDVLTDFLAPLQEAGIRDTLLVSPDRAQIEAAARVGSAGIELNARSYAAAKDAASRSAELAKIMSACDFAYSLGLSIAVGRGLQYDNVQGIAEIHTIEQLTIGHAIIARALYFGLPEAVAEMKHRLAEARHRR
jgi:pyridoxine 5-phosphate synthase